MKKIIVILLVVVSSNIMGQITTKDTIPFQRWDFITTHCVCEVGDNINLGVLHFPNKGPWELMIFPGQSMDNSPTIILVEDISQEIIVPSIAVKMGIEGNESVPNQVFYPEIGVFVIVAKNTETGDLYIQ